MKDLRLPLILAFTVPLLAYLISWHIAPPSLNTDSATGFAAWETWRNGGPWNHRIAPDYTDIAQNEFYSVAWWSPGQYMLPGLLRLLGLDWLQAARLSTLAAAWFAVFGVWLLGRRLDLSPAQASLAALACAVGCGTLHTFGMFWGGDIFLAGIAPFVYLAALRLFEKPLATNFAVFFLACLSALFCKHGGILVVVGALAFVGLESLRERGARLFSDARPWLAGGGSVIACTLARWLWMGSGPTPGDAGQVSTPPLTGIGFALNGPWFALTGSGSLLSWLLQRGGHSATEGWRLVSPWLLASGLAATSLVCWLGLRPASARPWRLAACAWVVTIGLLCILYLRGASVSIDERHFRAASAPLAIALAFAALPPAPRSIPRVVSLALLLLTLALGTAAHVRRVGLLANLTRGPVSGFTQPELDAGDARLLAAACPTDATLLITHAAHSLEFPGRRILSTDAYFREAEDLRRWRFAGTVPLLLVPVPRFYDEDGRGAILRASFVDVPAIAWQSIDIGNWRLWSAETRTPLPSKKNAPSR